MRLFAVLPGVIALLFGSGCRLSSKWALDDPDYAAKYDRPYEQHGLQKQRRMAKQMVDARFLKDKTGVYLNGAAAHDPTAAGGEIGIVHYGEPWTAARIGLAGLARESDKGYQAGVDAGLRVQVPSRFSPYVGFGGFAGYHKDTLTIHLTGHDDEPGPDPIPPQPTNFAEEQKQSTDGGLAAVYPEIGTTFWFNGHAAFNTFGRYYITTDGRDKDFWMAGVGITFMQQPRTDEYDVGPPASVEPAPTAEPYFHSASLEDSEQPAAESPPFPDDPFAIPEKTPSEVEFASGQFREQ
jgi:hypothetical protein